jgi:hypothetical protein
MNFTSQNREFIDTDLQKRLNKILFSLFLLNCTIIIEAMQTSLKPLQRTVLNKVTPKSKRNLDNSLLRKHFGKTSNLNIWDKDIFTGEGNE